MAEARLLYPKLAVFGASGPSGQEVVKQALAKGHSVTAVVRSPDKFTLSHENLEVVKGDVFQADSLIPILEGKNAVMSCLGFHRGTFFTPTTLYSKSITEIITAMERNGIERLVCITGIYTQNDPGNPRWITMLRPFMRSFINDMVLMENTVMQSNLIYTIMRPPILTNGAATDNYMVAEGQFVPKASSSLSRADLAHFMLKSLQSNEWDKKGMAIAGGK
ncbi:unnamed protein product [Porites evermanni]|uniref:NAD(P)-binding domain-containing protein n=1 Tax=Porites evermanni TaxID=104178 RepID=A0ABN8QPB5_9CNID|nr:unnamed protein product [Porites evermanni]